MVGVASWDSDFFVVRESGFWMPKDYKKDKTANVSQFVKFEDHFCYIGMKPKDFLHCPTDYVRIYAQMALWLLW